MVAEQEGQIEGNPEEENPRAGGIREGRDAREGQTKPGNGGWM